MERERTLIELRPIPSGNDQMNGTRTRSLPPPPDEIVSSPVSLYSLPSGIEYMTCPCTDKPSDLTVRNKKCSKDCIRLYVLRRETNPDLVIWHDKSDKVVIEKKESGYGFRVKEKQSPGSGEYYTFVHEVKKDGAAEGKLLMGEHLLSANQVPLQNKSNLKKVLSENTENSVTLIKCRPIGYRIPNQRRFSPPSQHPLSDLNRGPYESIGNDSLSDGRSSSSGSTSLMRIGSKNSKESSGSSCCMQLRSNPSSPDVNVNMTINLTRDTLDRYTDCNAKTGINFPQDIRDRYTDSNAKTVRGACGPSDVSLVELNPQDCTALNMRLTQLLSSNMPRLPKLKLFILGKRSTSIAECLSSKNKSVVSKDDICTKYKSTVLKTDRGYEWVPVNPEKNCLYPIANKLTEPSDSCPSINLRNSRLPSQEIPQCSDLLRELHKSIRDGYQGQSNFEEVDLEIIAMNQSSVTDYCGHILYNAHGVYIVQFDLDDYIACPRYVLTYIQTQLTKIRTYASDRVQVFLVATARNPLPFHEARNIGQDLDRNFSSAFCNQLHYNPVTHLPCHFVYQQNHLNNLSYRARLNRLSSCEDNTSPSNTTHLLDGSVKPYNDLSEFSGHNGDVSSERNTADFGDGSLKPYNGHSEFSRHNGDISSEEHGNIFDTEDLKRQVSSLVFQQGFVSKAYPYQYLVYQEKKNKFCETHQPVGALKSQILSECAVDDVNEQASLLKYLHDAGDIICIDDQPYNMMISQYVTSRLMVLLNRDRLIDATKKLLLVPNPSDQDAPHRNEWNDLQNDKTITQSFLQHLLGTDAVILGIFLDAMNVIYCMNDGLSQLQGDRTQTYFVPFFFPDQQIMQRHLSPIPYQDRVLYLDFNGFMPHGTFMRLLVQLIGESEETKGAWKIHSKATCELAADDFELKITLDPFAAVIKIEAEWTITCHAQSILALLDEQMRQLQLGNKQISYKLGPQCPYSPRCQGGNKLHVLDIGDNSGIFWCGKMQIDQELIKQWLPDKRTMPLISPTASRRPRTVVILKSAHIGQWPFSLYKWICDHLNMQQHSGRNWKMLAEKLGYRMRSIKHFEGRRITSEDPCDSLLQDWGRTAQATLESLLECLQQIGRSDMIEDLKSDRQDKWHVI